MTCETRIPRTRDAVIAKIEATKASIEVNKRRYADAAAHGDHAAGRRIEMSQGFARRELAHWAQVEAAMDS